MSQESEQAQEAQRAWYDYFDNLYQKDIIISRVSAYGCKVYKWDAVQEVVKRSPHLAHKLTQPK